LDVARAASDAFIARVDSELEERTLRQQNFGLPREITMPIVEGLRADLHTALEGLVQDAIRGRHGDQQIVLPSAMRERVDEYTVVNIAAPRPGTGEAISPAVAETGDAPSLVSIAPSALAGMQDIVADGVVVGTAWVPPPSPPGAETLLPPVIGRSSATLEGADTISAGGVVFPPEWEALKQELIQQRALLRQTITTARWEIALAEELRRDDARVAGIGHNQPPESIELPSVDEIVNDALAGSDAVLVEDLTSIRAGARLLRRTLPALEATGRWLAVRGELVVDEFLKQMGKRSADAITIAGAVKAFGGITAVVTAILALVGGLFAILGQVL
jgi:hypothetical protein